ncbi:MAG: glycerate kinase [Clostridium sp.]|nr:glycerate kinase [Clostridium sp.]
MKNKMPVTPPDTVVAACDSFKGSLTSEEANSAVVAAVAAVWPGTPVRQIALGDGGEGTARALAAICSARPWLVRVCGPAGDEIESAIYLSPDSRLCIFDSASVCGLTLLDDSRRDPTLTTTRGIGQIIKMCIARGVTEFIVGLGGSATNDGGTGMLAELGFRFCRTDGSLFVPTPLTLGQIARIEAPDLICGIGFTVVCDVDSPLCGPAGASLMFSQQKGASAATARQLESEMESFGQVLDRYAGRKVSAEPGAGAAGGLGAAFAGCLGGRLRRGIDMVLDCAGFDRLVGPSTLVVTGEGRIDRQTLRNKAPLGVMRRAVARGSRCIALAGKVCDCELLLAAGFEACVETTPAGMPLAEAMDPGVAERNLTAALTKFFRS